MVIELKKMVLIEGDYC